MPGSIPAPSLAVVKQLAGQLGIIPQREAGQNFLINPAVAERVIAAAVLASDDTVLEIGPGFGWLTQRLGEIVRRVVAVEIEKRFLPWLRTHLQPGTEVVRGNVLEVDLTKTLTDRGYVLVSFLPYSITAKVLRQFLTRAPRPKRLVLMVQKEVAERICATAGDHSKLSVLAQRYGRPELLEEYGPEIFWPQPAVDSALIRIELDQTKDAHRDEKFWQLIRIGFSSRRKTLLNNLINGYRVSRSSANQWLATAKISEKARPQELTIEQWESLVGMVSTNLS